MGLRYFHILLIATAILFGVGFGGFSFHQYQATGAQIDLISAMGSWLMAVIFSVYLYRFFKKNILK